MGHRYFLDGAQRHIARQSFRGTMGSNLGQKLRNCGELLLQAVEVLHRHDESVVIARRPIDGKIGHEAHCGLEADHCLLQKRRQR